ncbi:MAG: exodeoxyribonuclease VII small subunit [Akkermansia sp.]
MAKSPIINKLSFEQSISRLEEIIQKTDTPVTELEEMITLVEEGTKLLQHCRGILNRAELRIEALENPELAGQDEPDTPHDSDNESPEFTLD